MNYLESFKAATRAIWANKMRSLLTMLGIIIGISSVITVVSLGQGGQATIDEQFESFGVNRAIISTDRRATTITKRDNLNLADAEAIETAFSNEIQAISPKFAASAELVNGRNSDSVTVNGVAETYNSIDEKTLIQGRYLTEGDIDSKRQVVVIDEELATLLFDRPDVLGEKVFMDTGSQKIPLTVVGIYELEESIFGMSSTDVFVPITTVQRVFSVGDTVSTIDVNLQPDIDVTSTLNRMTALVERRHKNEGDNKYSTTNAESVMSMMNDVMGTITALIAGIAAISLLVGGIGVMNIMLVSVTERTREIGIRKAIGARHRDIMFQFLTEAVLLSLTGGIIGTGMGIVLSNVLSKVLGNPAVVSAGAILIAWAFSVGVGIFFGIYPANKAAKLDPIVALRYE